MSDYLVTITYQRDGKTYMVSMPSSHAEWAEEMLSTDLYEVRRQAAEEALSEFVDEYREIYAESEMVQQAASKDYWRGADDAIEHMSRAARSRAAAYKKAEE